MNDHNDSAPLGLVCHDANHAIPPVAQQRDQDGEHVDEHPHGEAPQQH